MPFMIGKEPVRRTLKYLMSGQLVLKIKYRYYPLITIHIVNIIRVQEVSYFGIYHSCNTKNPTVQIVTFKNMTPSPFIKCYYEDGKTMLIDIDSKSKDEILQHLIKVVGKPKSTLMQETKIKEKKDNPANFGVGCEKAVYVISQDNCHVLV